MNRKEFLKNFEEHLKSAITGCIENQHNYCDKKEVISCLEFMRDRIFKSNCPFSHWCGSSIMAMKVVFRLSYSKNEEYFEKTLHNKSKIISQMNVIINKQIKRLKK